MAEAARLSGFPLILGAAHQQLVSGLIQLEATQWLPPAELRRLQLAQASALLRFAAGRSPWMGQALSAAGVDPRRPLDEASFRRLPILRRRDVLAAGDRLFCDTLPPGHAPLSETHTSGSTGEPVRAAGTALTRLMNQLHALRDHAWHERDLGGRLCAIRATAGKAPAPGVRAPSWAAGGEGLFRTGPFALLDIDTDLPVQARWLADHDPDYLLTYPSNLQALLDHTAREGRRPRRLKGVRTVGESVPPDLRDACRDGWGVELVDLYSSEETGYLALQCPAHEHLHVQGESVILEVLDAGGQPCKAGEVGRIVVTVLHNLATPLIRYEIGDLGALGPPCPCGRGLPVLEKVIGRTRHMVRLPGGERFWPLTGYRAYRGIHPGIRQYQVVQESLEGILVRLVADRPGTSEEEAELAEVVQRALHHPFTVRFEYVEAIPREAGGKYLEFKGL